MIARLLELELSGFRCFPATKKVPLDADVVLIHGTNGTGKSSLLAALEFGLTGGVQELSKFESDYPRCLRNVHATASTQVAVRFRTHDNSEETLLQEFDRGSAGPASKALSREEARFFRDRCYLSQSSLGRLLENYQACSKEDPEQPLVRFVRELLGLDLLENLTAGLHEAANITRMEKAVPALQRAREDEAEASQKAQGLELELRARTTDWEQSLVTLQAVVTEFGDPAPNQPWTQEGVEKRAEAHAHASQPSILSDDLQRLRHSEGLLQRALGVLVVEAPQTPPVASQQRLDGVVARIAELERSAKDLLVPVEAILTRLGLRFAESTDLPTRINAAETALRSVITRRQVEGEALTRLNADLNALRERQSTLANELAGLQSTSVTPAAILQRWAEVLAAVLDHIEGDICPVCRRDYSELGRGDLRSHVADEINHIGSDARRMEDAARHREQLAAEHAGLVTRVTALEVQAKVDQERHTREGLEALSLENAAAGFTALALFSREWQDCQNSAATLRGELAAMEMRERQHAQATADIEQIVSAMALPNDLRSNDPRVFATSAIEFIRRQVDSLEKQAAGANRLREALDRTVSVAIALQNADRLVRDNALRLQKAGEIQALMRFPIESARRLTRAATDAKTRLLEQVFNERLNTLWAELYARLARFEGFHPRLAVPRTVRGLIRTSIEGCREDIDAFQQFASVASSGNLNTAAFSLFLSLHLIEKPLHKFIVLDDPVQSMDDLHIVQLANLLKEIRRQAGRQLILAVHERSLFDYLRLELGPTERGASLLTIELRREAPDAVPDVTHKRVLWKPDALQFGQHVVGGSA